MRFRLTLVCGLTLFCGAFAFAQDENVAPPVPETTAQSAGERPQIRAQIRKKPRNSSFLFGSELTQTSGTTGSLAGIGPRVGFEYAISEKLSLSTNITFALQATGKPGAYFYSGFTGAVRYALSGSNLMDRTEITDGQTTFVEYSRLKRERLQLVAGIEQLFLNGSNNIFPAIGFTAQGVYSFQMLDNDWEFDGRMSQLLAGDRSFMLIGLGLSMSFSF
ncbi:MAG: hypothetical protein KF767_18680 [Bdellovibrionaceae bacterium]|nr:hypothetical protein [Pseudobdellovibrionaceae bacterium]